MITLTDWLDTRKAAARQRQFDRGYEWAAALLLRSKDTKAAMDEIDARTSGAFDYDPFDAGAQLAAIQWRNRMAA